MGRLALASRGIVALLVAIGCFAALAAAPGCSRSETASGIGFSPLPTSTLAGATERSADLPGAAKRAATAKPAKRAQDLVGGSGFDLDVAMRDMKALSDIGVKRAGSPQELKALQYVERRLREYGYEPEWQSFKLPNGAESHNVVATAPGTGEGLLIVGAHVDSKPPAPGANDNCSGAALTLELARILAENPASHTVELDFYGAEEISDGNPDHHHAGSRYRASVLTAEERAQLTGMLSVDMVGYGTRGHARTMGKGPMSMANALIAEGKRQGIPVTYLKDPGSSGWSDHEPFELLGIPSVWLQWLEDPTYHTPGDKASHVDRRVLGASGRLVLGLIRRIDESGL